VLRQIVADKNNRLAKLKKEVPLEAVLDRIGHAGPPRSFKQALMASGISVIAEIKKASPSKGNFGLAVRVSELAQKYELGGAAAISVLTEEDHFKGSVDDLCEARLAVSLPVLRKDFIIDSYQLYESRMLGADAVLLIAGLLPTGRLKEYLSICAYLGLDTLVETRSAAEIAAALQAGASIIGINNRDLNTFDTDIAHTEKLAHLVPEDVLLVSESGIFSAQDVRRMAAAGADAVLIGEAIVKAVDIVQKIKEMSGGQTCGQDKNLRN